MNDSFSTSGAAFLLASLPGSETIRLLTVPLKQNNSIDERYRQALVATRALWGSWKNEQPDDSQLREGAGLRLLDAYGND